MKKETDNQKRKRLIREAYDMEQNFYSIESELTEKVSEIKKLFPAKRELNSGVQDLIDCYYWGNE